MNTLGELAIAHLHGGDPKGAFCALDEAVNRDLEADLTSEEGQQLLPSLGHCASYFGTMAAIGNLPDGTDSASAWRREFRTE
jgi:hypothetical protein